ncbi:MAG: DUF6232 family protein [Desulfobulbaceae bacterium]|nr:DUF6232 family protein [Desulfobulbaceae bacterium]
MANAIEIKEQVIHPRPSFLELTPKTIRLDRGNEIFPISNITKFGKYKVNEPKFPIYFIVIAIVIAIVVGIALFFLNNNLIKLAGIISILFAVFCIWKRMRPGTYAFGFETCSGTSRYLYTENTAFIDRIIRRVSKYIESEQSAGVVINIDDHSINTGNIAADGSVHIETGNIVAGGSEHI